MTVHDHGAVCPFAWCRSHPLHRSKGWGRDSSSEVFEPGTILLVVDFAENYTFSPKRDIQSELSL